MIKFYVKIPAKFSEDGKAKRYLPSIGGFVFDDMPFDTATEAHKMGTDLFKELMNNPDIIFEWEEKYGEKVVENDSP